MFDGALITLEAPDESSTGPGGGPSGNDVQVKQWDDLTDYSEDDILKHKDNPLYAISGEMIRKTPEVIGRSSADLENRRINLDDIIYWSPKRPVDVERIKQSPSEL